MLFHICPTITLDLVRNFTFVLCTPSIAGECVGPPSPHNNYVLSNTTATLPCNDINETKKTRRIVLSVGADDSPVLTAKKHGVLGRRDVHFIIVGLPRDYC